MEFEWDEGKRTRTILDRNLDFADADSVLSGPHIALASPEKGEHRIKAIGYIGSQLVAVIYTMRGHKCRIISMRRARPKERQYYERAYPS